MTSTAPGRRPPPVPSATAPLTAFVGCLAFVGADAAVYLANVRPSERVAAAGVILALTAAAIVALDVLVHRVHTRASTGLDLASSRPSLERSAVKTVGFCASLLFVAAGYWLFPEYHGSFYSDYYRALQYLAPPLLLIAPIYIYVIDRHQREPLDGNYQAGLACLGGWRRVDRRLLGQHALGWLIKGFFLPLMFTYFVNDLSRLVLSHPRTPASFADLYTRLYDLMYFADVGFVSMGYVLSLRIIDTHLRSAEPTLLGWAAAVICYEPFWSLIGDRYLAYGTNHQWGSYFAHLPALGFVWGLAILLLTAVYLWATLSFGARFSNLTHRGIITSGPYRYLKHPAYVAKNLSWWLIAVPFVVTSTPAEAVRHSLLLVGVNAIYALRAATEERHLRADPTYRAYADWIRGHGLLARMRT